MTFVTPYRCRDPRRQSVPSLIVFCCLAATATFLMTGERARATEVEFLFAFGSEGSGDGQFSAPEGIAVGNSGNIYVTDVNQNRVQVFDSGGNFQFAFGSSGTGDDEFDDPRGIAVGNDGDIYVVDKGNWRVQTFDSGGNFQSTLGSFGTQGFGNGGPGDFRGGPYAIAAAVNGDIYATDNGSNSNGVSVLFFGRVHAFNSLGTYQSTIGSFGSDPGEFTSLRGLAVDSSGNLYVADIGQDRVQVFDSSGNFKFQLGSFGTGEGEFDTPWDVAVDSSGDVYVADLVNDRVQVFDSGGNFQFAFGSTGTRDGEFMGPAGIAIGDSGNVHVLDFYNHRVQVFRIIPEPSTLVLAVIAALGLLIIRRRSAR